MSIELKGKDILHALHELQDPADLSEIVDHLSVTRKGSKIKLLEVAKTILEAGVRFGYIGEDNNKYHSEYINENDESQNRNETDSKDTDRKKVSKRHEVKSVMSVNELDTSSDSAVVSKRKKTSRKFDRNPPVSSDDEDDGELHDPDDHFLSRFKWKRTRSRSNSKRRNNRRRKR